MAKAQPREQCGGTIVTYTLAQSDLEAAKRQILRVVGKNPVIFMLSDLPDGQVELMVASARLQPTVVNELERLAADGNLVRQLRTVDFENELTFGR